MSQCMFPSPLPCQVGTVACAVLFLMMPAESQMGTTPFLLAMTCLQTGNDKYTLKQKEKPTFVLPSEVTTENTLGMCLFGFFFLFM